jgi:hypothetical protein
MFRRRIQSASCHLVRDNERCVIGRSRHWDGLGSTSAMWLIADDGGIEQLGGSILHQ